MRNAVWLVPALTLLAMAGTAPAQDNSRQCRDDSGANRCDGTQQAKVRAMFGAAAIDDYVAEKALVMRSFYVDGYGRDQPLVEFVRGPGREPELIVTAPGRDGGGPIELRAAVPVTMWDRLTSRSKLFDRALTPAKTDEMSICLHSWVVTVETVDSVPYGKPAARRKTASACGDELTVPFAFELAEAAVALLPACGTLDPEQHRNDVARLGACTMLEGDRAAAAQAMNRLASDFKYPDGPDSARSIAYLFDDEAELRWPDAPTVTGMWKAGASWADRMSRDRIYPQRFIGETPDRVRIEAEVGQHVPEGYVGPPVTTRATMVWTRENGSDFRLRTLDMEPFRTAASASSR